MHTCPPPPLPPPQGTLPLPPPPRLTKLSPPPPPTDIFFVGQWGGRLHTSQPVAPKVVTTGGLPNLSVDSPGGGGYAKYIYEFMNFMSVVFILLERHFFANTLPGRYFF